MTQKQLIARLVRIQKGIEGDNFTWENIEKLINDIKSLKFTEPEIIKELFRIINQVESDRFTRENLLALITEIKRRKVLAAV